MSPRGTRLPGQLPGGQVEGREAQNVRGLVHLPHLLVDFVDGGVVGEAHVDLAGEVHPLGGESRPDDLAEEGPLALTDAGDIRGDRDIVPLCHYFFPPLAFLAFS